MDLETDANNGLHRENSLVPQHGMLPENAVVKMAQTFRSGTNDIDALDFLDLLLDDDARTDPSAVSDSYVFVNFRPVVTKRNWRMDCGVRWPGYGSDQHDFCRTTRRLPRCPDDRSCACISR